MKLHTLYLLSAYLIMLPDAKTQTLAGETLTGYEILDPAIHFTLNGCTDFDSATIDVNCDGEYDLSVTCYKGWTAFDETNYAELHILNDSIEICADTVAYVPKHLSFFGLHDTLHPSMGNSWHNESRYTIGLFGFWAPPIWSQTNKYIAYKIGDFVGWINISFDLNDDWDCYIPIHLDVNAVLSKCTLLGEVDVKELVDINVFPNPSNGVITITSESQLQNAHLDIFDLTGKKIYEETHLFGHDFIINLKTLKHGSYLVHINDPNGLHYKSKLIVNN